MVPLLTYDTAGMTGGAAFETWRQSGWPGFGRAFDIGGDVNRFYYRGQIAPTARMTASSFDVSGLTYARPPGLIRRDGADHILVQSTLAGGTLAGEAHGVAFSSSGGTVGVVDLGVDLAHTTADTRAVCLLLSRDLFSGEEAERLTEHGVLARPRPLLADFMASLQSRLAGASPTQAARAERAAAAVLLACWTGDGDAIDEARPALDAAAIGVARRFVRSRLAQADLSPGAIAAAVGVSRATLYRVFEAGGGVGRFVLGERLAAARDAVLDPADKRSLTAIAQACGFADGAHFSRSFRERYGVRPSDLRPVL
jgi:AraC-like DNA-binding protein